jgi:hypothetical protein
MHRTNTHNPQNQVVPDPSPELCMRPLHGQTRLLSTHSAPLTASHQVRRVSSRRTPSDVYEPARRTAAPGFPDGQSSAASGAPEPDSHFQRSRSTLHATRNRPPQRRRPKPTPPHGHAASLPQEKQQHAETGPFPVTSCRSSDPSRPPRSRPPKGSRAWRRTESNRRPPACKAGALPIELRPHKASPPSTRLAPGRDGCRYGPGRI